MDYDVIIIGAGHAGCEAALAASKMGCKTLIFTLNVDTIALMPFNPSIGGPGKSHLVREIDALGGEMAKVADQTRMQIRYFDHSSCPSQKSILCQVDRISYQMEMRLRLERQENLDIKQAVIEEILVEDGKVTGIRTKNDAIYHSHVVVLATGTFMAAKISVGEVSLDAGRQGEMTTFSLSNSLSSLGLQFNRFQVVTSPRIHRRSVDFKKMTAIEGEYDNLDFSSYSDSNHIPQVPVYLAHMPQNTVDIMNRHVKASLFYRSFIKNIKSYADDVHFYSDIFRKDIVDCSILIEPDGLKTDECYIRGLHNALPPKIQLELLQSIPGFEKVEMTRAGYGIEFDILDPTQLNHTLETKLIKGLFTAGQINGTSGYEEAAAQGLIAGINSASFVKCLEPLKLDSYDSYIGVMIDDLITKGIPNYYVTESNSASHESKLKINNTISFLGDKGYRYGLRVYNDSMEGGNKYNG